MAMITFVSHGSPTVSNKRPRNRYATPILPRFGAALLVAVLGLGGLTPPSAWAQAGKGKSAAPALAKPDVTVQAGGELLERANALYGQGEFAKAILLYEKAEARGADAATTAFNIGNCHYRLNALPLAAGAFRRSVRLTDGKYLPALFNLAAVLFRLEQYGESIAAYKRALGADPSNLSAWLYLADAYSRTGNGVGALQALEKARGLDPEDVAIIYQMAEVHANLKEYNQAIDLVREAYARKPAEVDFLFYIGDLQRAQGNLDQAAAAYREGLSIKDKDVDAMYKIADVLAQDQKPFLAVEWLQKALAIKPDFTDAWIFLGNLAFDAKWWDRAENAYLEALGRNNGEGLEGLRNLAYEYHQRGDNVHAVATLKKAQQLRPNDRDLQTEMNQYEALEAESKLKSNLPR
jgi:tetratricopeptide (TPR) repeat protein